MTSGLKCFEFRSPTSTSSSRATASTSKIDWENLKKVGITADTLKNTRDFDRVMRGYKSRNTYTVSGTVGGFYLKPTDVKLSFYQAKDGTVVPSCTACSRTKNCCNARSMNTSSPSRNRATCKALAIWAASLKSKTRKRRANPRVRQPGQVHARTGVYAG